MSGKTQAGGENDLVVLEYDDLVNDRVDLKLIEKAYGFNGLGLLAVHHPPGVADLRRKILSLAHR